MALQQMEMIDCSLPPHPPRNTNASEEYTPLHTGFTGCLYLPADNLRLYQSRRQEPSYRLEIAGVIEEATRDPRRQLANACVLDAMIEDTSRIPESWKEVRPGRELSPYIVFAGTVFTWTRAPKYKLVRVLSCGACGWYSFENSLDEKCMNPDWCLAVLVDE